MDEAVLLAQLIDVTQWASALADTKEIPFGDIDSANAFFEIFCDGKNLCHVLRAANIHLPDIDDDDNDREDYWKRRKSGCELGGVDERFVVDMETFDTTAKQSVSVACIYLLCNFYAMDIALSGTNAVTHFTSSKRTPLVERGIVTNVSSRDEWLAKFVSDQGLKGDQTYTYIGGVKAVENDTESKQDGDETRQKMHGFGRLVFVGGEYIGQFANGRMHGWCSMQEGNKTVWEGR